MASPIDRRARLVKAFGVVAEDGGYFLSPVVVFLVTVL